jgi:hypothetical protein
MTYLSHNPKVTGSNPVPATSFYERKAVLFRGHRERIQHSFGHLVFSQKVAGPDPVL